ncbi:hypothetical protein SteCoe_37240 [Stentor coeruleus]|uniref:non-specific serine/threonine protein kinase n=1 Tax=Stentor coeruleus TaxID=5963 RepID=A0A1R2ANN8_9CILI|nr:hypothetical protein SteCoe_37240 [Stentor coeruleus]
MGCGSSQNKKKVNRKSRIASVAVVSISPGTFLTRSKGSLSNNYTEIKKIGSGAFAEVKLCIYKPLDQKRAVKIIHKAGLHYQQMDQEYMLKEISVLNTLDHPNILRCYEIFEDHWKFYVAMEYCEGGELFGKIIKLKKFTEKQAAEIMFQLLSAVAYCHSKDVIHRDLKPENILLEDKEDGLSLKVADFGSSCFIDHKRKMTGCFGSAYYLAPEVLSGEYTEKCDIWSCGIILFILLTGKPPYSGRDDKTIINQLKHCPLNIKAEKYPTLSSNAIDLLQKLLILEPNDRISALEAISHPWVKSFRGHEEEQVNLAHTLENLKQFSSNNKLKDAVYTFLATQVVSSEEVRTLKAEFQALDKNGDGKISSNELMEQYILTMNEEDAKHVVGNIMKEVDTNQNGEIDYVEFLTACMNYKQVLSKNILDISFRMFDRDESGQISVDEIRSILKSGNTLIDENIWTDLVKEVDQNGDGVIDIREFIQAMIR